MATLSEESRRLDALSRRQISVLIHRNPAHNRGDGRVASVIISEFWVRQTGNGREISSDRDR
eukprot:COSAG02_NODE_1545_length_11996_cov_6.889636_13_plen_62_part_00